ncbi:hypothetical protein AVEN_215811-1 [Araneus ventricosus]|uniref:Secreted protein n=1 Tax=Araneus ventricosus TaxID=182803 RepID=A0A4Y2QS93_ARAVE|nr:hypothetical protein AVEN_215811-1 [Araneus ventricosus]
MLCRSTRFFALWCVAYSGSGSVHSLPYPRPVHYSRGGYYVLVCGRAAYTFPTAASTTPAILVATFMHAAQRRILVRLLPTPPASPLPPSALNAGACHLYFLTAACMPTCRALT